MVNLVEQLIPWAERVLAWEAIGPDKIATVTFYQWAKAGDKDAEAMLAKAAQHDPAAHALMMELVGVQMLDAGMPLSSVELAFNAMNKGKPGGKRGQPPVADAFIREEAFLKAKELAAETPGLPFYDKSDAENTHTACHVVAEAFTSAYGESKVAEKHRRFTASWVAEAKRKQGAITRL